MKQKHARTRSCYHPRPMKPHVHENMAAVCILPCPLDRAAAKEKTKQKNGLPSRVRVGQNARLEKILNLLEV